MEPEVSTRYVTADSLLYAVAHRPWLPPYGPWALSYNWNDALFVHYALPPEVVRPLLPAPLSLDVFGGSAWVSAVALRVNRLRWNGTPAIPFVSSFPLLALRTYVTLGDRPGIYCFSFDVASLSAIWFARLFLHLPYWHARMRMVGSAPTRGEGPQGAGEEEYEFSSRRLRGPRAGQQMPGFRAVYSALGEPFTPRSGTLERFLLDRYCYYSSHRGRIYRCHSHHLPCSVQGARALVENRGIAEAAGLALPERPTAAHYGQSLRLLIWAAERVSG